MSGLVVLGGVGHNKYELVRLIRVIRWLVSKKRGCWNNSVVSFLHLKTWETLVVYTITLKEKTSMITYHHFPFFASSSKSSASLDATFVLSSFKIWTTTSIAVPITLSWKVWLIFLELLRELLEQNYSTPALRVYKLHFPSCRCRCPLTWRKTLHFPSLKRWRLLSTP